MLKIDDEMRRWCETLVDEVSAWPRVTQRPMFGLVGLYRNSRIFAAVPRTRAVGSASSVLVKLPARHRLKAARAPAGWAAFEMHSPDDIPEALRLLERAYEKASARTAAKA
ncbi:MAG TPA: hypothetical protein VH740_18675 [Vicinamibacterales bacterium]|jgi:hypothetical protein